MAGWMTGMPKGMQLKSEGFASSLFDPGGHLTLKRYCAEKGIDYADIDKPVDLATFIAYGLDFQRRTALGVEDDQVTALDRAPGGFVLRLAGGGSVTCRRVVLATGIKPFHHRPAPVESLPAELSTHASDHHALDDFAGRDVTVLGAGSSAIDLAALLHEAGATVRLVARRNQLYIHTRSTWPRPLRERVRHPMSGIGPSWRSFLYTNLPFAFHHLSEERRLRIVKNHLGPAAGWFMNGRLDGVTKLLGYGLEGASVCGDRVRLDLAAPGGAPRSITTDHVISATGYRIDVRRYPFLGDALRAQMATVAHTPILSARFETSIPGLFVIGPATANSFGPVMRFVVGAGFTARRLARHLAIGRRVTGTETPDVPATLAKAGG
jgi:thioredoxin reductase